MTTLERTRSDNELLSELPDPFRDTAYVAACEKLDLQELDLVALNKELVAKRTRLRELQVDDVKSAKAAADLELKIIVADKQVTKLRKTIDAQQQQIDDALRKAKQAYLAEATELWKQEFIPELINILDRLMELKEIYRRLKGGGILNPKFPHGLEGAIGKNDLWLKRRKAEWFGD